MYFSIFIFLTGLGIRTKYFYKLITKLDNGQLLLHIKVLGILGVASEVIKTNLNLAALFNCTR